MSKVAIITGAASGMGLETAKLISKKGWTVHILDMNEAAGEAAVKQVPNSVFTKCNVIEWDSISAAFDKVYRMSGNTIDFVWANAGIVERANFYAKHESLPPPPIDQLSIDINYKGVVNTVYLAQHYYRASPHKGKDKAIVMTASCGAFYPSEFSPMYSGAKAGVVNFMRSIAFAFRHYDGIRCHAVCPGTVRTGLLSSEEWSAWPDNFFTPVEKIASTVDMLIEPGEKSDSNGRVVEADKAFGLAVEINMQNHYIRDQVPFCDEMMEKVMKLTGMEHQIREAEKRAAAQK